MSDRLSTEESREELVRALEHLAGFAHGMVPGCDGASVSLVSEGRVSTLAATQGRLRKIDAAQYEQGDGPCVTAMRGQETVVVDDYATDLRWPEVAAQAVKCGVHSSLSMPLMGEEGQTLGGLNMYGSAAAGFTATSQESASLFAAQAAVMLRYLHQLHTERAERLHEHQVAATLQRSLLPTLPALDGISSAARYLVSQHHAQVGGDWYDLFALPDGAIGVAIGDVMGHDIAAAAAMGQLRSVLRSYAYEGSGPSLVLERLDRLVQGFDMAQVATTIFGRLVRDADGARLLFANAGHLPPLVRDTDGQVRLVEAAPSPLIGVVDLDQVGASRNETSLALPSGSTLLLYTDGLVESHTRDCDTGIAQMAAAVRCTDAQADPEELCEAIVAAMGPAWEDDVALIAIRVE